MSIKVEVAELRYEIEKLNKRVKRDEKEGVLDGKEKVKNPVNTAFSFLRR